MIIYKTEFSLMQLILCFLGFLKKNENNLKEELARKRPDLIEKVIWNSHAKAPSQNGIVTGIV